MSTELSAAVLKARVLTPETLPAEVQAMKDRGLRFMTMTCVQTGPEAFDLLYHFDRDLELEHLRLAVTAGRTVPSISSVYLAAFLVENEIQDQFGLTFEGLAIDYQGKLYLDPEAGRAPFCTMSVKAADSQGVESGPASEES